MKLGAEIEFFQSDVRRLHNRDSTISEYYTDTWERNDFLETCTNTTARTLKEHAVTVMRDAGVGAVFGSSKRVNQRDDDDESTYAWNGLHLHISSPSMTEEHSISRLRRSLQNFVLNSLGRPLSPRQRRSHHIWGAETPDDFLYDYQKKSHFRPVAWRPALNTFEIRMLDLYQLIETPVADLTEFLKGLNDILLTGRTSRMVKLVASEGYDVVYRVSAEGIERKHMMYPTPYYDEVGIITHVVETPATYIKAGTFKELGHVRPINNHVSSSVRNIEERAESSGYARQLELYFERGHIPQF